MHVCAPCLSTLSHAYAAGALEEDGGAGPSGRRKGVCGVAELAGVTVSLLRVQLARGVMVPPRSVAYHRQSEELQTSAQTVFRLPRMISFCKNTCGMTGMY
jgi:hypothetical protein